MYCVYVVFCELGGVCVSCNGVVDEVLCTSYEHLQYRVERGNVYYVF